MLCRLLRSLSLAVNTLSHTSTCDILFYEKSSLSLSLCLASFLSLRLACVRDVCMFLAAKYCEHFENENHSTCKTLYTDDAGKVSQEGESTVIMPYLMVLLNRKWIFGFTLHTHTHSLTLFLVCVFECVCKHSIISIYTESEMFLNWDLCSSVWRWVVCTAIVSDV